MQDKNKPAHRTPNTPLKEVLAICEVKPNWGRVIARLTDAAPVDKATTFLKQLESERVLAKRMETSGETSSETPEP